LDIAALQNLWRTMCLETALMVIVLFLFYSVHSLAEATEGQKKTARPSALPWSSFEKRFSNPCD